ncbi:unnamed protein product [Peniophora sp. CBMAI 1063]|nr:unnamed protein product [Peniophora sp. CBMAI 1063]
MEGNTPELPPAHRLPPELLARLFFIYASNNDALYDLRWTKLLFVCKRWHDVGLQTQNLWSFIAWKPVPSPIRAFLTGLGPQEEDVQRMRRIDVQRQRAEHSLLSVKISLAPHLSPAILAYIPTLWEPSTLRYLEVRAAPEYMSNVLDILAGCEHPALTDFHISPWKHRRVPGLQPPPSLDDVLTSNLPNLRSLSVLSVSFNWTLVRNLRTLSITYLTSDTVTFNVVDVVDALIRCPHLQELSMRLPTSLGPNVAVLPAASLTCISELYIAGDVDTCDILIHAITDIPPSAKITVLGTSISQSLQTSPISSIASYMGAHASQEGAQALRSLAIGFEDPWIIADGPGSARRLV